MLLASCKSPEKANQPKNDNPDVSVTDKNTDEVKKEESKTPAPEMLEGEWILGSGMIEGEEYTASDHHRLWCRMLRWSHVSPWQ